MLCTMPIAHSYSSMLTPASTIPAGVFSPTVTTVQSSVPWPVLTPCHVNEVTHAIHARNAHRLLTGTLCPATPSTLWYDWEKC